jgi:nucleoside-diphosphate-sugar epimerase
MSTTAILGATGPTGIHLAAELRRRGTPLRVVARQQARLEQAFPDEAIGKREADALDADQLARALEGCDLVYDCIGLPGDRMDLHPVVARNLAAALAHTQARCVQVSSYWSYDPQVRAEMDESHPRSGGPPWVLWRREAEDVLLAAGAAVLHLPDFYGPHVHASSLQNALREAVAGKAVHWLGKAQTQREYVYVPDAMRIAADIGSRDEAFGAHWCLPGSGPLSGRAFSDLVSELTGRRVRLRSAGMGMLRLASLFDRDLRGLLQVAPEYMKAVRYRADKLVGLLGAQAMTPYEDGLRTTIAWIGEASDGSGSCG